jgi:hypothetical protein
MNTKMRISGSERFVATPSGTYRFRHAFSSGWTTRSFMTNVFVEAPRNTRQATIQLAVNEAHPGFGKRLEQVSEINNRSTAIDIIERMRHALFDYPAMPEIVHKGVINNIGRLALAQGMRYVDLAHPDIIARLHPVLIEYDSRTTQTQAPIHTQIAEQAFGLTHELVPVLHYKS